MWTLYSLFKPTALSVVLLGLNTLGVNQIHAQEQAESAVAEVSSTVAAEENKLEPTIKEMKTIHTITADYIEQMLKKAGYSYSIDDEGNFIITFNGQKVNLYVIDETSLMYQFSSADMDSSPSESTYSSNLNFVNTWNQDERNSRAYVDDLGNIILEADLDLEGGVTEEKVFIFIKGFLKNSFQSFLDAMKEMQSNPTASVVDASENINRIDNAELGELLKGQGYSYTIDEDGDIEIKLDGYSVYIIFMDETSIMFQASLNKENIGLGTLNIWNRDTRYSRTYLDESNHPVLELDLNLSGGVSRQSVIDFIRTGRDSFIQWRQGILAGE